MLRWLDHWLRGLYEGADRWNPLRPDRLGEALITRTLRADEDRGHALLAAVLDLHSDAQLERATDWNRTGWMWLLSSPTRCTRAR